LRHKRKEWIATFLGFLCWSMMEKRRQIFTLTRYLPDPNVGV
jgi:hypothetical protein